MEHNNNSRTGPKTDHAPDPYLMSWTAENLPEAFTYFLTDLDLIVRDRKGNLMLVEIKRRAAEMDTHQQATYELFDALIKLGIEASPQGVKVASLRFPIRPTYQGFHLLQFENTTFENGAIYWDNQPVTPEQLKQILSFQASPGFYITQPQNQP